MCVDLDWTVELALRDDAVEGCVLGLLDRAAEDDEQIDIAGVGREVVTDSCSVAVAPAEIVAADARRERHLEEVDQTAQEVVDVFNPGGGT